ncbi:MAG: 3-phosphoserine/phosphohydroxythreonine aminotransferase [Flavobacteriales bacterium]|nr:3-phosphoserine/phosphohydroxythreonine aminotransferase [Flavobacteriales bacterium]MBG65919.1 3-phosphoserine/phosphohydroxythreonine aminotransferase [Flavobacteriales bacterium]|tara:strand:+ start:588 stop:1661 length:1074 start_codon:yes stop_codon:yes gene_type:complete
MKKHNFSAGPCILPDEVLKESASSIINFNNLDLSLIEISHRSKPFIEVIDEAKSLVRKILNVPKNYSILFLQGGASLEFLMVPMNLMDINGTAVYTNTGTWANKAIIEAKKLGNVNIIANSSDKNYSYIPKDFIIPEDANYFHCTSNNTIYGTQIKKFPKCKIPMVCDMSSDIFSRKIDINKFDLIYAGAQKNMGPAGTTLVIVKDEILGKNNRDIPTMLDYRTHINKESMFNTPPVFAIYVSMLTLRWLDKLGGIDTIEKRNIEKAKILYKEIDRNELFVGTAEIEDRSNMNICFLLKENKLEKKFNKMCDEKGISGIIGHRSVGGYRASIYNAMPIESVKELINLMKKLEDENIS